jgi:hypothetical protein
MPDFIEPALATSIEKVPSGTRWGPPPRQRHEIPHGLFPGEQREAADEGIVLSHRCNDVSAIKQEQ